MCQFHLFTNNNNTFTKTSYNLIYAHWLSNYAFIDINYDGLIDIVSNSDTKMSILYQQADHTFGNHQEIELNDNSGSSFPPLFAFGHYYYSYEDYNNDGWIDISKGAWEGSQDEFVTVFGTENTFPSPTSYEASILNVDAPTNEEYHKFYPYDVDQDGSLDIVSNIYFFEAAETRLIFDPHNLNGNYEVINLENLIDCTSAVTFEDFNLDGKIDIMFLCPQEDKLKVLINESIVSVNNNHLPDHSLRLSPNPVTDKLTVDFTSDVKEWTIFNAQGQEISAGQLSNRNGKLNLDVSTYNQGVYLFTGRNGEALITKKFIVQ